MYNKNKNPNVPNLRFNFEDDYTTYQLHQFASRVTRKNKNNESLLPLTISAQYGLVDQISFFNKSVASSDLSNYYLLQNGEFAYNKSYSNDYPWGAIKRLDRYDKGCLSTLYICFKPNESLVDTDYLVHYFESPKWYKQVSDIAGEGARNHGLLNIAVRDFFLTKHKFPSLEEQGKVADLLNKIQERIEAQNKIIEEKRLLKNLIIDKIFFKSNTDFVPLSSLINLKNGYAFKSDCYSNSDGYKVITIGNVSGDRYLDLKKFNCISILPIDIQEHQILKRGDLLISLTGNVGRVSICNESNCVLNQRVGLIEFFDEDDKEYIYQIMSSKRFQNDMISRAQGAAQLNIGKDDILNYRIPYLNDSIKRKKISSVLSILDNVILTDENLLYAYDKQKQFLLNNLFI